jgi:hypothetical protein
MLCCGFEAEGWGCACVREGSWFEEWDWDWEDVESMGVRGIVERRAGVVV